MGWRDNELALSYLLGAFFTLMLLGFDMKNFLEEGIMHSIADQYPGRLDPHAGYYGLGINYAFFTIATLFSPAIVDRFGSKKSLVACSGVLVLYMIGFMALNRWIYFAISAFLGTACGVMWTAQGVYISQYTTKEHVLRNNGIFWAISCISFLVGGIALYILFGFTGNEGFTVSIVRTAFGLFVITGTLGSIGFLFLPSQPKMYTKDLSIISCINKNFQIMTDRRMQLTSIMFVYLGVQVSHFLGIFPTCMLFSEQLRLTVGNQMIGYYGVSIGAGEILAGIAINYYCKRTGGGKLLPVVIVGLVVHLIAYGLTFLSFHKDSKFQATAEPAYIGTTIWLSSFIAFLLAAGDSCWNTVRGAYLTSTFTENKPQVFAMSKFFQSIASCITFLIGKYINLHEQLLLNTVLLLATAGSLYLLIKDEDSQPPKQQSQRNSVKPTELALPL